MMPNRHVFDTEPAGGEKHIQQSDAHVLEKFTVLFVFIQNHRPTKAGLNSK